MGAQQLSSLAELPGLSVEGEKKLWELEQILWGDEQPELSELLKYFEEDNIQIYTKAFQVAFIFDLLEENHDRIKSSINVSSRNKSDKLYLLKNFLKFRQKIGNPTSRLSDLPSSESFEAAGNVVPPYTPFLDCHLVSVTKKSRAKVIKPTEILITNEVYFQTHQDLMKYGLGSADTALDGLVEIFKGDNSEIHKFNRVYDTYLTYGIVGENYVNSIVDDTKNLNDFGKGEIQFFAYYLIARNRFNHNRFVSGIKPRIDRLLVHPQITNYPHFMEFIQKSINELALGDSK